MDSQEIIRLIERAKRGDKEAFAAVYTEFLTPVYRYIFLRVNNKSAAEDLTQTVFIKAYKALADYKNQGIPLAYFFTIARNSVIDHFRKKQPVSLEQNYSSAEKIPEPVDTPEAYLAGIETQKTVHAALATLPEEQKDIVIMRYMSELSYAEIAQITGKSEVSLRQIVSRALKQMRYLSDDERKNG